MSNTTINFQKRLINGINVIAASFMLIIFFFLPWIEINVIGKNIASYSGWELLKLTPNIQDLFETSYYELEWLAKFMNLLYLIPILSIILICLAFRNTKKLSGYIQFVISFILFSFIYILLHFINIETKHIGIGLVGSIIIALYILYDGFLNLHKTTDSFFDLIMPIWIALFIFCSYHAIFNII